MSDTEELLPEHALADKERKRIFLELLTSLGKLPRERREAVMFGGIVSKALILIDAFHVHRETRAPGARDTWWHREWDDCVAEFRKQVS